MSTHILVINGSPRKKNNTSYMVECAIKGIEKVKDVTVETYDFAGKKFSGCKASCADYCMKHGKCAISDDLNEFMERYLNADGIIWAAPVYHVGPPAQVKCAVDRLCNVFFSYLKGDLPRLNKPCGILVQGSSRWGGQELTIQFFIEHCVLMKCLPVAGDMPNSYFGVAGYAPTWEAGSILEDPIALDTSEVTATRVAEMAKILKSGISLHEEELPDNYFLDKLLEKRRNQEDDIDMSWQKKK